MGLREEDYRWRSGGAVWRTRRARMRRMPEPARAWEVRAASPACADASHAGADPGPASPGRNLIPWHHPSPQGLRQDTQRTAEVEEAYMALQGFKFSQERRDVPGLAVGKDSDEALHRTFKYVVVAGKSNLSNGV